MSGFYAVPRIRFSPDPPTDWAAILRAAQGHGPSFVATYERYHPEVVAQFERALPWAADAGIEAEVFLEKFLAPSFLQERAHPTKGKFHNLLRAVAFNYARNVWRRPQGPLPIDPIKIDECAREAEELPEPPLEAILLRQAFSRLRRECEARQSRMADVVDMIYVEEMSYQEVAGRLDLTIGQVTMGAHRGKARLRELFVALVEGWRRAHPDRADEAEPLLRLVEGRMAPRRADDEEGIDDDG